MNQDYKLTAEEKRALRNFVIWFTIKLGSMFALRWAAGQAYKRYLREEGIDPNDPEGYIKLQAKIRAKRVAANN